MSRKSPFAGMFESRRAHLIPHGYACQGAGKAADAHAVHTWRSYSEALSPTAISCKSAPRVLTPRATIA
jgi:hypothetical protein